MSGREPSPATPSIRDVAAQAGVSIATVSRALTPGAKGVSPATRARVADAAQALGYRPDRIGRALRARTTDTYALVVSNIQNAFFTAVAWDLERALAARGKVMMMFNSGEDPALQDAFLDEIAGRRVSGLFTLCAVESARLAATARAMPVVLINRPLAGAPGLSFVGIDDRAAARELMAGLLRQEAGPLAIVHGPRSSLTSARRLEGLREALAAAGRGVAEGHVLESDLTMEGGHRCADTLLSGGARFAAIMCGNDPIAYGVHRRCRELGLAVPADLRIYGFDDNPLNEWLAPWLNTVRVPHLRYAEAAIAQMDALHRGEEPRRVVLPYEILLRA